MGAQWALLQLASYFRFPDAIIRVRALAVRFNNQMCWCASSKVKRYSTMYECVGAFFSVTAIRAYHIMSVSECSLLHSNNANVFACASTSNNNSLGLVKVMIVVFFCPRICRLIRFPSWCDARDPTLALIRSTTISASHRNAFHKIQSVHHTSESACVHAPMRSHKRHNALCVWHAIYIFAFYSWYTNICHFIGV